MNAAMRNPTLGRAARVHCNGLKQRMHAVKQHGEHDGGTEPFFNNVSDRGPTPSRTRRGPHNPQQFRSLLGRLHGEM